MAYVKGVDVEAFYVCVKFTQFYESLSTVPRGSPRPQICDKNHIFVTSLARFNFLCGGFSEI